MIGNREIDILEDVVTGIKFGQENYSPQFFMVKGGVYEIKNQASFSLFIKRFFNIESHLLDGEFLGAIKDKNTDELGFKFDHQAPLPLESLVASNSDTDSGYITDKSTSPSGSATTSPANSNDDVQRPNSPAPVVRSATPFPSSDIEAIERYVGNELSKIAARIPNAEFERLLEETRRDMKSGELPDENVAVVATTRSLYQIYLELALAEHSFSNADSNKKLVKTVGEIFSVDEQKYLIESETEFLEFLRAMRTALPNTHEVEEDQVNSFFVDYQNKEFCAELDDIVAQSASLSSSGSYTGGYEEIRNLWSVVEIALALERYDEIENSELKFIGLYGATLHFDDLSKFKALVKDLVEHKDVSDFQSCDQVLKEMYLADKAGFTTRYNVVIDVSACQDGWDLFDSVESGSRPRTKLPTSQRSLRREFNDDDDGSESDASDDSVGILAKRIGHSRFDTLYDYNQNSLYRELQDMLLELNGRNLEDKSNTPEQNAALLISKLNNKMLNVEGNIYPIEDEEKFGAFLVSAVGYAYKATEILNYFKSKQLDEIGLGYVPDLRKVETLPTGKRDWSLIDMYNALKPECKTKDATDVAAKVQSQATTKFFVVNNIFHIQDSDLFKKFLIELIANKEVADEASVNAFFNSKDSKSIGVQFFGIFEGYISSGDDEKSLASSGLYDDVEDVRRGIAASNAAEVADHNASTSMPANDTDAKLCAMNAALVRAVLEQQQVGRAK